MLGNKEIMAKNIKKYMNLLNKSQMQVCTDLNFKQSTFSDWVNGKTYPRIDKIEMLANYFGCTKADLVEENKPTDISNINGNPLIEEIGNQLNLMDDKKLLLLIAYMKALNNDI